MEKKYTVFRYIAYGLEIIILFVIQTTPFLLPEILGGRPLLLIPAALTIAFLEKEIPAMFFGLACGLLMDLGYSDNAGFYTFALVLICFALGMIFRDYMVVSFLNATAFTSVVTVTLVCLFFLFYYIIPGKGNVLCYFAQHCISQIIYTILCGMALYFLNRALHRNLRDI